MRISILSNVNLDMLSGLLKKEHEIFQPDGYGEWISYALRREERLAEFSPECLILLLDGNELLKNCMEGSDFKEALDQAGEYVKKLCENYEDSYVAASTIDIKPSLICGKDGADFGIAAAAYWDGLLTGLMENCRNLHRFELRKLIEAYGRNYFYSQRFWYMGSIPYDMKALHTLSGEIKKVLDKLRFTPRKVLVLDLDNTLWGGVAGEDGPEGIILDSAHEGAVYQDAQRALKRMQRQGVLLAVASKNNIEDVRAVFEKNPHMVLKENDFAAIYANWRPKHENVSKMAEELNLGLDAFVFVDDNEAERKEMECHLPEVAVPGFPADISELPDRLEQIYEEYFWNWKLTEEDKTKTEQYQQEKKRRDEKNAAASYEEYLKSLDTQIRIVKVNQETRQRAVQLMNKTNQFNVCTLRMDEAGLEGYLKEGTLLMAEVSDKYGNSGWVAEILYHIEGKTAVVDNFLMSCRVMGRNVEHAILTEFFKNLSDQGMTGVLAFYKKTAKNRPVEALWDGMGFTCTETGGEGKKYFLDLQSGTVLAEREELHTVHWDV